MCSDELISHSSAQLYHYYLGRRPLSHIHFGNDLDVTIDINICNNFTHLLFVVY
jgi:hypothetical protein